MVREFGSYGAQSLLWMSLFCELSISTSLNGFSHEVLGAGGDNELGLSATNTSLEERLKLYIGSNAYIDSSEAAIRSDFKICNLVMGL